MITPDALRHAATQRRNALDCDNAVSRMYDAAAEEIERLRLDLAAYQEARAGLLEAVQRLSAIAEKQRALLEDASKGLPLKAIRYNGEFYSLEDIYAILGAAPVAGVDHKGE